MFPTREEIHEAYLPGEEAIVVLSERTIGKLATRVQALEEQLAQNTAAIAARRLLVRG